MQESGRLDVAGLVARIILVAECITLAGGGRLDMASGRANPAGGWPSELGWAGRAYHTGGRVYPAGGWWPSGRGLLVGGDRLDVAGGRANPAGGWPPCRAYHAGGRVYPTRGWWSSGRGWWQSVSRCE